MEQEQINQDNQDNTINQDEKMTVKQNVWQAVKFTLFSSSAGLIQTISFTLLNEFTRLPYWPCYLIALILSVLYNFTVNRRFTFKSATNVPIAMLKVAAYYAVFTPLSTWAGQMAANHGVNEYIVFILTMISNLITEYSVCRFWVYRNSMNTNDLAMKEKNKADRISGE
jgi:putative flippase GtrA